MLFRREPSEVSKKLRMQFIAMKTKDGKDKGKTAMYGRVLKVSRQGFYGYLKFDCFDAAVPGLAMDTNMKAPLCVQTLKNAYNAY